jgi:mannosyltransferase OCH1-like enzyme
MIPKDIYICYKNLQELKEYSSIWKELNPEYTLHLYDDQLCIDFLEKEYSSLHADIFKYIPDGPIKADFWRICILYRYGGLYVDADIEPIIPLREYIDDTADFVTCFSYQQDCFNPHFLMAYSGDHIFNKCIDTYIKYYNEKKKYDYWDWSIVYILNPYLRDETANIKQELYTYNNKKYQFLTETFSCITSLARYKYCTYKGFRVLNNNYKVYDSNSHQFRRLNNIPVSKIIHFILPEDITILDKSIKDKQNEWMQFFPNWDFRIWKYEDIEVYLRIKYFWFHRKFRLYPSNSKPIVFKYFILHEFGGICPDNNYECTNNFENELLNGKINVYENDNKTLVIASPKDHIFWQYIWEYLYDTTLQEQFNFNINNLDINKCFKYYSKYCNIKQV